ncbi:MAG: hypothetical protein V4509_00155 [Patescibacteria group bacterium]
MESGTNPVALLQENLEVVSVDPVAGDTPFEEPILREVEEGHPHIPTAEEWPAYRRELHREFDLFHQARAAAHVRQDLEAVEFAWGIGNSLNWGPAQIENYNDALNLFLQECRRAKREKNAEIEQRLKLGGIRGK